MNRNCFALFCFSFVHTAPEGNDRDLKGLVDRQDLKEFTDKLFGRCQEEVKRQVAEYKESAERRMAEYKESAGMKGLKMAACFSVILVSCVTVYFIYYCMK